MLSKVSARLLTRNSTSFFKPAQRGFGVSLLLNDQLLDDDQKMIQEMAYGFAKVEFEPYAAEWDRKKHFPMDQYKKAAELGFAAIYVSEEHGGCGLGRLEASLIFEALSTGKCQRDSQRS